jgi:FAD/FMN-containing dehydrogenase
MSTIGKRDTGIAAPGDPAYEAATSVFNLAAPARPAAAVTARTVGQIASALRHAAAEGMPVRVHTTGHAAGAARPMDGALLVRPLLGGGVQVDARAGVARIPAGTRWGAVVEAAAAHGLTAPHGSSPTVGVVGYLLGGGLSFYGRAVGLAANAVRAVELVTADGRLRRADADGDPELLWALRGGGGGFGVVTTVELELFPAAKVITGAAYWPAVHAERLLARWRAWTLRAPREATTSLRIMNLPRSPDLPPALTAGPLLSVDGAVLAATGDVTAARRHADDLLGPLRAVAEPVLDTWALTDPSAVLHAHLDPAEPVPFHGDHMLLGEIGDDGAAEFLRTLGEGSGSPLVVAGFRQLGGAYAEPCPNGGVLDRVEARYAYMGSGAPFGQVTAQDLKAHCAKVRAALRPWDTGRTMPSVVESFEQPQRHLDADQVRAVDRVRARVDPDGLFRDDISPNATAMR